VHATHRCDTQPVTVHPRSPVRAVGHRRGSHPPGRVDTSQFRRRTRLSASVQRSRACGTAAGICGRGSCLAPPCARCASRGACADKQSGAKENPVAGHLYMASVDFPR